VGGFKSLLGYCVHVGTPLGGKGVNMNAAFEQVGRTLDAEQITVLPKMQCCVGFLEVKWQSSLLVLCRLTGWDIMLCGHILRPFSFMLDLSPS